MSSIGCNKQETSSNHTSSVLRTYSHISTSLNMRTSKVEYKHLGILAEVQALGQHNVPDEMDNLDEMLTRHSLEG
jgi:hypothetical protein